MKTWMLDNLEWLVALGVVFGVAALLVCVLLWRIIRRQREALELLDIRFNTLQEDSRRELMTMGQRIIDAEKQVRRFSDRVESLEAANPGAERYGQLESLLAGKLLASEPEQESAAELQLKSLLQRGKSGE